MGYKGKLACETRCGRCDAEFGNVFHICLDKNDPSFKVVHPVKKSKDGSFGHTEAGRQAISEAAQARWAKHREDNRERDEAIIDYYKSGRTLKEVRKKFRIGQDQASKLLHGAGVMRSNRNNLQDIAS